ncbi:MAG: hypothetical protein IJW71_01910, partial [Clostridia bacterium]|nr:hypothetical protein [Clostridia bacterium]
LGAKTLTTQVGQDTGARLDLQNQCIVDTLKAAKPILEENGITVLVEPLNTYHDHKRGIISGPHLRQRI